MESSRLMEKKTPQTTPGGEMFSLKNWGHTKTTLLRLAQDGTRWKREIIDD